jgi:two-component system, NarL family, nitrate/nitrite response regulator NarL
METTAATVRVLIADDHRLFRDGLKALLKSQPGFVVVGEAANSRDAIALARQTQPDILLLDLNMPGSGLEAARELCADQTKLRTILLTAEISQEDIVTALQFRVQGVVLKDTASDVLFRAIRSVMAGQYWLGRESVSNLIETLRKLIFSPEPAKKPDRFGLTPRELGIVSRVCAGYTNKEIAKTLSISEDTVKHHLSKIYDKVGMSNRLELALFAIHNDLVEHQ